MGRANRYWAFDMPVGDPFGGPAAGLRQDPMTAMVVMMGAATAVGAAGAIQQGKATKAAAEYNATISAQNAEISRADAATQAQQIDRENYLRLGAIRTAQGKSGGAQGEGSVLDVLGDVAAQGELDKQYALYQGEQRARGFTNTATLDTFRGRQAQKAGYLKAGTELLSGGAKAYGVYASQLPATNSGYSDFVKGYTPRNYG